MFSNYNLSTLSLKRAYFDISDNIKLAYPTFYVSGDIDLLLDTGTFLDLLCVGKLRKNKSTLQKTLLGWVVGGDVIDFLTESCVSCCQLHSRLTHKTSSFLGIRAVR